MISQVMEQIPRPRRFSFTKSRQEDMPRKSGPPVTTIGFPIDALPLYSEKERREICISPTWNKSRGRSRRSQSVGPAGPDEQPASRSSSRRLVKKQPVKTSRRDSSVASDTTRFSNVPLLSSISTRIRSRRASISNNAPVGEPTLPPYIHQDPGMTTDGPLPTPRLSATLPPGFNATITKDLAKGSNSAFVGNQYQPSPTSGQQEVLPMNGYPVSPTGVEKKQTLRRSGVSFYHSSTENVAQPQPSVTPKSFGAERAKKREVNNEPDRKEVIIPHSLRIGPSKVIEPGPKSPKRALAKIETNQPQYGMSKPSPQDSLQARGKQNESKALPASYREKANFPTCSNCQSSLQHAPKKVQTSKQQEADQTPALLQKPTYPQRPPPEQQVSMSIESAIYDVPKFPANSPAVSNPSTTDISTPGTSDQENASSSTDLSTWSSIPASSRIEVDAIPRNTASPRQDKYLAKIFVICCQCNFWHDIPSGLYAKMIIPDALLFTSQGDFVGRRSSSNTRDSSGTRAGSKRQSGASQSPSNESSVHCCWCSHELSKNCCSGWTTMVHLLERHH
ncbi:hypothetical protein BGW36DRAFT_431647 [Talaromyces proteolyticus]|uniref:Uncharacterized protein n=1 Tax=Talaromyces proteolyticus TaxID=1131652 RepID=A0AAD4KJA2_9EURO|nr:uncharacterized protein BGW36DRAFT_431647 [Talaromyces proteolyticus]KAH8692437.1 hypothetical protein BGW36DRAFT_431647 [Talaromyces proteolyticus]